MFKYNSAIFITTLSFMLFSFVFLFSSASIVQAASLRITSPNGGEEYRVGDTVLIFWESDTHAQCTFSYITPEVGPAMSYYVGSASTSANFLVWTASKPSQAVSVQQMKIQMACAGLPVDYSDNYFTVSDPAITPTVTPTITPTPTPEPICNRSAQLTYSNTASVSAYRGQTVYNDVLVTNPNDPECGPRLYGISNSYPGGWNMELQNSVVVNAGETASVPLTITSDNNADYRTYQYWVGASDASGGVIVGASNFVTIIPRCDLTVQASLQSSTHSAYPGSSVINALVLTNPNHAQCTPKNYIFSRSYPSGWSMNLQNSATVNSGQTIALPLSLTVSSDSQVGAYGYSLWVYNSWADGSGQAQVNGTIHVLDNIAPSVAITSPLDGSTVARNSTISITANANDNVSVGKVEFYVNGMLLCTDATPGYSCSFDSSNRKKMQYSIMVKAYDDANNVSNATSTVTTK